MPLSLKDSCRGVVPPTIDWQAMEGRLNLLEETDRELMRAIWIRQQPATEVAVLMGRSARMVRYRTRKLLGRIKSETFTTVAWLLPVLDVTDAAVARAHFCQGKSIRRIAREMGFSLDRARRKILQVRGMIAGVRGIAGGKLSLPARRVRAGDEAATSSAST